MKHLFSILTILSLGIIAPSVSAGETYTPIMNFETTTDNITRTYNAAPDSEVKVLLPKNSQWKCIRTKLIFSNNKLTGGFICKLATNPEVSVGINVECNPGNSSSAAFAIDDKESKKLTTFSAYCYLMKSSNIKTVF